MPVWIGFICHLCALYSRALMGYNAAAVFRSSVLSQPCRSLTRDWGDNALASTWDETLSLFSERRDNQFPQLDISHSASLPKNVDLVIVACRFAFQAISLLRISFPLYSPGPRPIRSSHMPIWLTLRTNYYSPMFADFHVRRPDRFIDMWFVCVCVHCLISGPPA